MARREYRNSFDKLKIELFDSKVTDIEDAVNNTFDEIDTVMDSIESDVNDAIGKIQEIDTEECNEQVAELVNNAIKILGELSLKVF